MAAPNLGALTTNTILNGTTVTPPPAPTMPKMGAPIPGFPNGPGLNPKGYQIAYQNMQTAIAHPSVAAAHNTANVRTVLRSNGYKVNASGNSTARLLRAWSNFQKSGGDSKGAAYWNAHNPLVAPKPAGAPGAGQGTNTQPTPSTTAPGTAAAPVTTAPYNPSPSTSNVVPGMTLAQQNALLAQYQALLAPKGSDPKAPNINVNQFANAEANMQYGPAITALQNNISTVQNNQLSALQGVDAAFAPAINGAADDTASTDASTAANLKLQQSLGASVAAALGLSGTGAAATVEGNANDVSNASAQAANLHAQAAANQTDIQGQASQAHVTANAATQANLASLRSQLVGQQQAKGAAVVKGKTDAQAEQDTEEGNYQSQLMARQAGKVAAFAAAQSGVQSAIQDQGATQTQTQTADQAPAALKAKMLANHKAIVDTTAEIAQIQKLKNTPVGTPQTPWATLNLPQKAAYLNNVMTRVKYTATDPQDAMNKATSLLGDQWSYASPEAKASVYAQVKAQYMHKFPGWTANDATHTFTKKKTTK